MAIRPFITPADVKAYTTHVQVKNRLDAQMTTDILRAEQAIISYCGHNFGNAEKYATLPEEVKTACILLAEAYAMQAMSTSAPLGLKSEQYDNYSYTKMDEEPIGFLGLGHLLNQHIDNGSTGKGVVLKAVLL